MLGCVEVGGGRGLIVCDVPRVMPLRFSERCVLMGSGVVLNCSFFGSFEL